MKTGKASIKPAALVRAGSYVTMTYTYTAEHPIDESGYLKIVFRHASDIGTPQFETPAEDNYCTVKTDGDCEFRLRWDPKGHVRPWSKALYIQVISGFLGSGEKINIVFGDRTGGSRGWQMQTFCEKTFEFKTFVDPVATYKFKEIIASPALKIVPAEPARAVCIAPSSVKKGANYFYHVKIEDRWGNPVSRPRRFISRGFADPGFKYIRTADKKTGFSALSNPVLVDEGGRGYGFYWADFHGQSEETIGTNSIDDYFKFARDYALLDISAHQGNDFQVTDEFWARVNELTGKYNEEGKFITFPGYEWSGNTPLGGDRNVYYKSEGGEITRSSRDLLPGASAAYKDSPSAGEMFKNLKGEKPFVFAHVGGRYADLSMHKEGVEVAVEIHSVHGTFEWLLDEALERGWTVGVCANSDDHTCRPGAAYPGAGRWGAMGGLTCVLAEGLTRDKIHEAVRRRRFYATTGNRCLIDMALFYGKSRRRALMGDIVRTRDSSPELRVNIGGTDSIERVEVRNGVGLLAERKPLNHSLAAGKETSRRIKIVWSGAEIRGRNRICVWDGALAVKNNRVKSFRPVNFSNPMKPVRRTGSGRLEWESTTTGGKAGVILELEDALSGSLDVETIQGKESCRVKDLGFSPDIIEYGGVGKRLAIYRLPQKPDFKNFAFKMPLKNLRKGMNPVYLRVSQEDGNLAWTSPVYIMLDK